MTLKFEVASKPVHLGQFGLSMQLATVASGECRRCRKPLLVCNDCKGKGYLTDRWKQKDYPCNFCGAKGYLCPDHGKDC